MLHWIFLLLFFSATVFPRQFLPIISYNVPKVKTAKNIREMRRNALFVQTTQPAGAARAKFIKFRLAGVNASAFTPVPVRENFFVEIFSCRAGACSRRGSLSEGAPAARRVGEYLGLHPSLFGHKAVVPAYGDTPSVLPASGQSTSLKEGGFSGRRGRRPLQTAHTLRINPIFAQL